MQAAEASGNQTVDLTGQVALVTGGGRGLGPRLAEGLAAAGAAVAITARTTEDIAATAQRITASGGRALAVTADVTNRQAVERLVAEVEQQLGPVDVLVNNAAMNRALDVIWEVDPEQWWGDVEVNLRGPFLCARAVLPHMIARHRGRIINVASGAGLFAMPAMTAYAASKAALINFTNSVAQETKEYGISVFAIHPGTFRSPMAENALESAVMRQWHPWFHELFADGRDDPPERAMQLVVSLASGVADRLSGRFVGVDDDLAAMLVRADDILRDDLHTLRLRVPHAD
jgi:NAD(P)-dependent dehydrogenase (short-subunit alcohol dehydrogenase family)